MEQNWSIRKSTPIFLTNCASWIINIKYRSRSLPIVLRKKAKIREKPLISRRGWGNRYHDWFGYILLALSRLQALGSAAEANVSWRQGEWEEQNCRYFSWWRDWREVRVAPTYQLTTGRDSRSSSISQLSRAIITDRRKRGSNFYWNPT